MKQKQITNNHFFVNWNLFYIHILIYHKFSLHFILNF